jgi:hypothetical protein
MTFPPEPMTNTEPKALQAPVGATYNDEFILQPQQSLSQSEQLALLDWHPLFTGRCPECEMPIVETGSQHWNCANCGWKAALSDTTSCSD